MGELSEMQQRQVNLIDRLEQQIITVVQYTQMHTCT